ncbi:MAG: hypothetical protein RR502_06745 [Oscillospiraceae bacterium]
MKQDTAVAAAAFLTEKQNVPIILLLPLFRGTPIVVKVDQLRIHGGFVRLRS